MYNPPDCQIAKKPNVPLRFIDGQVIWKYHLSPTLSGESRADGYQMALKAKIEN